MSESRQEEAKRQSLHRVKEDVWETKDAESDLFGAAWDWAQIAGQTVPVINNWVRR